jgi:tRNA A58 N-methylase Trm61
MEILPSDCVLDIGCGTGIFLFYLASKKFEHLHGIEYNENLIQIALKNQKEWKNDNNITIHFNHGDALSYSIPPETNVFYFFNTFLNKETYMEWIELLKNSLIQYPRKIKIVLLLPTEESVSAFLSCSFLHKKCDLKDSRQFHSDELYYAIFANSKI